MTTLGERLVPLVRQRAAAVEAALLDLSDEQVWHRVTPDGNPVGNLVLHLAGNLRTYIARGIGGQEYTRDRPFEFQASGLPRDELASRFREAVEATVAVLSQASDEHLSAPWPGPEYSGLDRASVALHSVEHLGYHAGQIALLVKVLTAGRKGSRR